MSAKVKKLRVLLIDDERSLMSDRTARTCDEGIKALKEEGPWDVLLLDYILSSHDENGREQTGQDVVEFLEQNPSLRPKLVRLVTGSTFGAHRMGTSLINMGYHAHGLRDFHLGSH